MKKVLLVLMICMFLLTSCYYDLYHCSLNEYIDRIDNEGIGYSSYEIDNPDYFLPSKTFLSDYKYISGEFYFYEEDPIKVSKESPSISLLILEYDKKTYFEAKDCMISNIPPVDNVYYTYNDYSFYRNKNFIDKFNADLAPDFPKWFTMAGFNDENNTLCFIGFFDNSSVIDKKYYDDFNSNYQEFIDTYYGKYHNFSE